MNFHLNKQLSNNQEQYKNTEKDDNDDEQRRDNLFLRDDLFFDFFNQRIDQLENNCDQAGKFLNAKYSVCLFFLSV
jgi:hypothetical protein